MSLSLKGLDIHLVVTVPVENGVVVRGLDAKIEDGIVPVRRAMKRRSW